MAAGGTGGNSTSESSAGVVEHAVPVFIELTNIRLDNTHHRVADRAVDASGLHGLESYVALLAET